MKINYPKAHFCAKIRKALKLSLLRGNGTLFVLLLSFFTFSAVSPQYVGAGQASLAWNASSSTGISGYKVYYGTSSGNYTQSVDAGNSTSISVSNLTDGKKYYFAAKAYDSAGDVSGYSNETSYTPPVATTAYTITASAGSGGAISPPGAVAVSQGLSQTFTITPSSGYTIAGVTVDGASVGAVSTYTFSNITANHTISATFAPTSSPSTVNTYTLTASAGTGGLISPSGTVSAAEGSSQTYNIITKKRFYISNVVVDGKSVGVVSSYTFSNIAASHNITVYFQHM